MSAAIARDTPRKGWRWALALFAALAALLVYAQVAPVDTAAVIADIEGTVLIESGNGPPRRAQRGQRLRLGDIVHVAPDSLAVLKHVDGQITAVGERSTLRVLEFRYDPRQPEAGSAFLHLIEGSARLVMGSIGERNPAAIRVHVGRATKIDIPKLDLTKNIETGVVVQGEAAVVTVDEGRVGLTLPSGKNVPIESGKGALVQNDGTYTVDEATRIATMLGKTDKSKELLSQLDVIETYAFAKKRDQATVLTLATLPAPPDQIKTLAAGGSGGQGSAAQSQAATPAAQTSLEAQQQAAELNQLPAPAAGPQKPAAVEAPQQPPPPPPVQPFTPTLLTSTTASAGGGTPCAASCN